MDMTNILGLASLMTVSYVATNLDNLLLLVVLLGAHPRDRLSTLAGHLTAACGVLLLCLLAALAGTIIEPHILGYLGLIPVVLGLRLLHRRFSAQASKPGTGGLEDHGGWVATAMLLAGNSGDTLAIFVPLFAESDLRYLGMAVTMFVAMTLAWAGLAMSVSSNLARTQRAVHLGERLVPWVMLAAGGYVLLDTATDSFT